MVPDPPVVARSDEVHGRRLRGGTPGTEDSGRQRQVCHPFPGRTSHSRGVGPVRFPRVVSDLRRGDGPPPVTYRRVRLSSLLRSSHDDRPARRWALDFKELGTDRPLHQNILGNWPP